MPTVTQIRDYLARLAPVELAESWDNVGALVDCGEPVSRVLAALDITEEVAAEAKETGCQLIVSHHPVIFTPLKSITRTDVVFRLIQSGISAVCMHTNLDSAVGGVNDVLAGLFGLTEVKPLEGMGRVGLLPAEISMSGLAQLCREKLGAPVRYADPGRPARRLAVLGGSGGDFIDAALSAGADCLLTGEASHHEAIDALQKELGLIVAGHYETEYPVVPMLAKYLSGMPGLTVTVSQSGKSPFCHR